MQSELETLSRAEAADCVATRSMHTATATPFVLSAQIDMSDREFHQFQRFIYEAAGISMNKVKKALVSGRLSKRLKERGISSFGAYFSLLHAPGEAAERQCAIDVLTTNETYFFRESRHFDALRERARSAAASGQAIFRVWSAASSSGEEAYSVAMVLADAIPAGNWQVIGSDISQRILQRARVGHYQEERANQIPEAYLKRFCRKGTREMVGTLLIEKALRDRVTFSQINLNTALPSIGQFDVIFLRNVMIYFSAETRRQVIARIATVMRPGGYLYIGLSESLNGISDVLSPVSPSIYVKR